MRASGDRIGKASGGSRGGRRGLGVRTGLAAALLAACLVPAGAQDALRLLENYQTEITVYGDRLPLAERLILDSAAPIVVITREAIEASGVQTVQEILAQQPGITLHSQTGNPAESTVDLRGFPQGTSLAVFLDGVRLNDLQDNAVRWDLIPLKDVDRIEVYAGASAPLYGGGALAGVVNVVTRRMPGIPRLDVGAGAGSFGSRDYVVRAGGTRGPLELYLSGSVRRSDGWRENDGHRLDDALARGSLALTGDQTLTLLLKYAGGLERQPGALTAAELARDPRQSPFNLADGTRGRHRLASLSYRRAPEDGWSLSAQAFARLHDRDTLTTGRYGSGFLSRGAERLTGLTAEAGRSGASGNRTWEVRAGAEASSGSFDGRGFYTDIWGEHPSEASSTRVGQRFAGAFVQADAGFGRLHFTAGARTDEARYLYTDRRALANNARRTFRESTWRAGLLLHTGDHSSAFLTFARGYRIPSVVDLFAYPGFYSNPDLVPTRSSDWEAGWRIIEGGNRLKVTAYRMRVSDEVVFVLTDPQWFIGQNRNVGRSFRRGLEAEAEAALPLGFRLFASGSYQDAEVTAGPYAGRRIPMLPRAQGTAGVGWGDASWTLRLAAGWVGPQRLDNDLVNARAELPGYATVDLSVRVVRKALTLEASATNVLDRGYVARGITNGFTDYYTPAYPLAFRFGVTWSF